MIADMICNKKLDSIVTELFFRELNCLKLNISLVFMTQSYFKVARLNTTHFFFFIANFREIATSHSSDIISTKNFTNTYKKCSFLVNDSTLASDNPLRFRKLFLEYNKNHDNYWSD